MKVRRLNRGRQRGVEWILDYSSGGKRLRRWFDSRADAERELQALRYEKAQAGEAWTNLTAIERADLMSVHVEAAREGVTLRALLEAYRNRTLAPQTAIRRTLGQCIDETLAAKAGQNLRPRYVRELGNYLHSFAAGRQQLSIDKITVADIEGWFDGRGEAPATRCSNLGRLGALFDLAWRRRYLPENPCLRVTQPRLEQKPPRILSPKEAKALLVTCRKQTPDLLAWLTLGVFAGIRPDELRRLAWADVDAQQGLVTVAAAASKVRRRRIVTLHETARSWLSICKPGRPDQPITPSPIREKRQRARLVGASGVKWSHDLLRHSAASFLLAHHQDAGKVANMLGNSVRILESTYKNLVTPSDCAAFWKLTPAICKNKGP